MRRLVLTLALAGIPLLAACGGGEVVVQAAIQPEAAEGAEASPLPNVEVRALPYDRDVVFDSLRNTAGTPEPEIPDSLMALQTAIAEAQEQWAAAEAEWGTARDSLQKLSQQMRGMSRGDARYVIAYRDFGAQETVEQRAKRTMDTAFERFTSLQSRFTEQSAAVRAQRQAWGDEAFAAVNDVIEARLEELGLEEHWDTTNANGVARFDRLKKGQWWIHARYDLPYTELYWNVPVEVTGGDPVSVVLNRGNAQVRPKL